MVSVAIAMLIAAGTDGLAAGEVEKVASGFGFTEGPVCLPDGSVAFSDIPADTIYLQDRTVFRRPSGKSNGLTLDREGRLLACEHWNRRVTRTEADGSITVLADRFDGRALNSPNDLVVDSKGRVYFTDPTYGLEGRDADLDFSGVYLLEPGGQPRLISRDFTSPNGLAFSPDETLLYVGDSAEDRVRAYPVEADGTLGEGRVFCSVKTPDGMKVDTLGRLWITSADGVAVYSPDGSRAGVVRFPEQPANCAFGGPDGRILWVTAQTGLYRVETEVAGIRPGPEAGAGGDPDHTAR